MTDQNHPHAWYRTAGLPLAVVGLLIIQTAGVAWWASDISSRVKFLERENARAEHLTSEITSIRAKQDVMADDVRAIKQWLFDRRSALSPAR